MRGIIGTGFVVSKLLNEVKLCLGWDESIMHHRIMAFVSCALFLLGLQAFADDIEVYFPEASAQPNILFVIDFSNSMHNDYGGQSRRAAVVEAFETVLADVSRVNIGVMRLNYVSGGAVLSPVEDLDAIDPNLNITARERIVQVLGDAELTFGTPTIDALLEAAYYFRGDPVYFGLQRGRTFSAHPNDNKHGRVSHFGSHNAAPSDLFRPAGCTDANLNSAACANERINGNPVYKSPIANACHKENHIVLMTDGLPWGHSSADEIRTLIGRNNCISNNIRPTKRPHDIECGADLIEFLATQNQANIAPVKTHTIGLGIDDGWLQDFARRGQGIYATVQNKDQLVQVINDLIAGIMQGETTVLPPVAASNFRGIAHKNDLYLGVFRPALGQAWAGNVHKYKLHSDGIILDAANNPAIETSGENAGKFKSSSRGLWSSTADGGSVDVGGALSQLPNNRKIYTHLEEAGTNGLHQPRNRFSVENALLTEALLGVNSPQERTAVIDWARGGGRTGLFDPLHSGVHMVSYAEDENYVLYGDNGGFLRMLDADSGEEQFAFIPQDLIPNLNQLRQGGMNMRSLYGVDGPISIWRHDAGKDGEIKAADGDHVYVYFGLRRGGHHIYALNITDPAAPEFMWHISPDTEGFETLGQTWSRLVKTQVLTDAGPRPVLLFAGGYDADKDTQTTRTPDDQGAAIYMIDPVGGQRLWSAGPATGFNFQNSSMVYSIPADIKAIDTNGDRLMDRFYVGDTGGQLWRFDVNGGQAIENIAQGQVIANISSTGNESNDRRFFETPDVSMVEVGGAVRFAVSIGSGNRANPKGTAVNDAFYMFFDDVAPLANSVTPLTESDLFDTTTSLITQLTGEAHQTAINTMRDGGWFFRMPNTGEKVLSKSVSFGGVTYFTTYTHQPSGDICLPGEGVARLYAVSTGDAVPAFNANGGEITVADRAEVLKTTGLAPSPTVFRVEDDTGLFAAEGAQLCVGIECKKVSGAGRVKHGHWREIQ